MAMCLDEPQPDICEKEWKNCSALKMILTVWLAVTKSTKSNRHTYARGCLDHVSRSHKTDHPMLTFRYLLLRLLLLSNRWIWTVWNLVSSPKRRRRISFVIVHNSFEIGDGITLFYRIKSDKWILIQLTWHTNSSIKQFDRKKKMMEKMRTKCSRTKIIIIIISSQVWNTVRSVVVWSSKLVSFFFGCWCKRCALARFLSTKSSVR